MYIYNQYVTHILLGGIKSNLQVEAMAIFALAMANHVRIKGEWIPRELNQTANYISRITDYDDKAIDLPQKPHY